jgi:hypothetical protein
MNIEIIGVGFSKEETEKIEKAIIEKIEEKIHG